MACAEVEAFCREGSLFGTDVFDSVGESAGFVDFFFLESRSIPDKDTDRVNDEDQYNGQEKKCEHSSEDLKIRIYLAPLF